MTIDDRQGSVDSVIALADVGADSAVPPPHDGDAPNPLQAVGLAQAGVRDAEHGLAAAVTAARAAGHSWAQIGKVLGTSRQAAFQRFGRPLDPRTGTPMAAAVVPGAAERAIRLVGDVTDGRWARVRGQFVPMMAERLDAEKLAEIWARIIGTVGNYERIGSPTVFQAGDYTVVDVPLEFEAGERTARVSIDADRRVAGLHFLRPSEADIAR